MRMWWMVLFSKQSSCGAIILLAKTKETFKISELQQLEATIQAQVSGYTVTRELLDRSTGSSLFQIDVPNNNYSDLCSSCFSNDSWWKRCDWVGKIVVKGSDARDMLEKMKALATVSATDWTLDYMQMRDNKMTGKHEQSRQLYTMKSLLCAVAHEMPSPPSLDPIQAKDRFLMVDTTISGEQQSTCYLIQRIDNVAAEARNDDQLELESFSKRWTQRPFQYSSAINFSVADIVMEILDTLCKKRSNEHKTESTFTLWDPTCGSGTFLALALRKGYHVEGFDYNERAVGGTQHNLEFMFSKDDVEQKCKVELRDSSSLSAGEHAAEISCVTANLPWGRNSVEYVDGNSRILQSIRRRIADGTPCAFVTRPSTLSSGSASSSLFEQAGFEILGQAFVPQRDFGLPTSKKKPRGWDKGDAATQQKQQCLVTIAIAGERGSSSK